MSREIEVIPPGACKLLSVQPVRGSTEFSLQFAVDRFTAAAGALVDGANLAAEALRRFGLSTGRAVGERKAAFKAGDRAWIRWCGRWRRIEILSSSHATWASGELIYYVWAMKDREAFFVRAKYVFKRRVAK